MFLLYYNLQIILFLQTFEWSFQVMNFIFQRVNLSLKQLFLYIRVWISPQNPIFRLILRINDLRIVLLCRSFVLLQIGSYIFEDRVLRRFQKLLARFTLLLNWTLREMILWLTLLLLLFLGTIKILNDDSRFLFEKVKHNLFFDLKHQYRICEVLVILTITIDKHGVWVCFIHLCNFLVVQLFHFVIE